MSKINASTAVFLITLLELLSTGAAIEYPYQPYNDGMLDPQVRGWPLTDEEKQWVILPEYTRKPGHEAKKHIPAMWPVTPTAGFWGVSKTGTRWLDNHTKIIEKLNKNKGKIDILLIGDSITQYIGESPIDNKQFIKPWKQKFGSLVTVNAGIGGDRTENVLWRLEHGLLDNISPEYIVLMVGTNNAPLVAANGVPAKNVAWGIKLCVDNIRKKCPETKIILSKVLPAFSPGKEVYKSIENINNSLDLLNIDKDPKIIIIDLWKDFTESNGSLIKELYSDGHLHISEKGYEVYLDKLKLAFKAQPK